MFGAIGWPEVFTLLAIVFVIPLWQILKKSGRHGAWSLFAFIPPGGLIILYVVAFSEWPVQRELRRLKSTAPSV